MAAGILVALVLQPLPDFGGDPWCGLRRALNGLFRYWPARVGHVGAEDRHPEDKSERTIRDE